MCNFLVRYASRVVIYDHRAVTRLATDFLKVKIYFRLDAIKLLHKSRNGSDIEFQNRNKILFLRIKNLKRG